MKIRPELEEEVLTRGFVWALNFRMALAEKMKAAGRCIEEHCAQADVEVLLSAVN